MNFNDNFDLKKAKSFLLTENFQMDETENLEEIADRSKENPKNFFE